MKIKFLGAHNIESENTRLVTILIDGMLSLDASALTSSLSFQSQRELIAVLITHHHYDHIRDIPALAMNLYLSNRSIDIYATVPTIAAIKTYLLNDDTYPRFFERPSENPVIRFNTVIPDQVFRINAYNVLPVAVNHSVPATGYQITSGEGKTIFYTGDTGKGLDGVWENIAPQLLIIELTAPNKYEQAFGNGAKHMTPSLLYTELSSFKRIRGYVPHVMLVHMNPLEEPDIATEIEKVAGDLQASITLAHEGQSLVL
jgi:ribonuclease BN (tRNA processing enzyme)